MIKCRVCKKDLPESDFYASSLKKNDHICRKCHKEYSILKQKQYRCEEEAFKERDFQKKCQVVGGWKIIFLNYVKKGEYRFQAQNTDGRNYMTNDPIEIRSILEEIFENVCE